MSVEEKENVKINDKRHSNKSNEPKNPKEHVHSEGCGCSSAEGQVKSEEPKNPEEHTHSEGCGCSSGEGQHHSHHMTLFSALVFSLIQSSLMGLGHFPNPETNEKGMNLEIAQQNINLLNMLKEKTKGNLDKEEENLLESGLFDLQMKFVEASKK